MTPLQLLVQKIQSFIPNKQDSSVLKSASTLLVIVFALATAYTSGWPHDIAFDLTILSVIGVVVFQSIEGYNYVYEERGSF